LYSGVSCLNLSRNTNHSQTFMVFLSSSRQMPGIVPQIRSQPITARPFLFIIHLSFDAV
jgi:hypothetical protein